MYLLHHDLQMYLIYSAKQMTGFFAKRNNGLKWVMYKYLCYQSFKISLEN